MKTSFVSNITMQTTLLRTISEAQSELMDRQKEIVTLRHADLGAELGAKTARTLNLHRDLQRLQSLQSTNSLTTQRLAASQEALGQVSEAANTFAEREAIYRTATARSRWEGPARENLARELQRLTR